MDSRTNLATKGFCFILIVTTKNLDSSFNFSPLHSILLSHVIMLKIAIQPGILAHTVIPAFKRPRQKDGKSENKQDYTK